MLMCGNTSCQFRETYLACQDLCQKALNPLLNSPDSHQPFQKDRFTWHSLKNTYLMNDATSNHETPKLKALCLMKTITAF